MSQNLSLYNKTDPSAVLTVIADRVTATSMARTTAATWLSKSLGAGAITESVGVSYITKVTFYNGVSFKKDNIWANVDIDSRSLVTGGHKYLDCYWDRNIITVNYRDGSSNHVDQTVGLAINTERLIDISLSGQVYTVVIYNGATVGSGVLDVLTINAGETPPNFEYHLACSNYSDGGGGIVSGYARTFEFTGLSAGFSTNPLKSAMFGDRGFIAG